MRTLIAAAMLFLFGASTARSADPGLVPVAEALLPLRSTHGTNELRNAGPELTAVKQRLREWVEKQLPPQPLPLGSQQFVELPDADDFTALSKRLTKALDDAGLTCGDVASPDYHCGGEWQDARGYLGEIEVSSADFGRYLTLITSVGVRCGQDQSFYLYQRGPNHDWKLLLQSEQDQYDQDHYAVQNFLSINVSPANVGWNDPAPPPLVLTLGESPWCSSSWQMLSMRLWRASQSTTTPPPLIDRSHELYIGNDFIAAARLTKEDLLVQFQGRSIDGDVLIRPHVLHYLIHPGDRLERFAPVALDPNEFVEEWLTSPWAEARRWVEGRLDRRSAGQVRAASRDKLGEFASPPRRCRRDPTLWQVSFAADELQTGPPRHFLVRWLAPYRFSLVAISHHPFPHCDRVEILRDDPGTLFPVQGGAS